MNQKVLKRNVLIIAICLCFSGISQQNIKITYVENMGVHVSNNNASVLIDGLHTEYKSDYLFPPPYLIEKITKSLKPDATLFTHKHKDHFSAQLAKNYLRSNPKSILFGSHQITQNFTNTPQIQIIHTKDYTKQRITVNDFKITGVKINHAGKKHIAIENVGFIIDFSHTKILHVGDTNWMQEISLFDQLKLQNDTIDIVSLPHWMLLPQNAEKLIKKYINPTHVIATHISSKIEPKELRSLQNRYPKVHFLTTLEQQIQL